MSRTQQVLWWLARQVYTVHHIDGIDFVDMRMKRDPMTREIRDLLRDALNRISAARDGFGELVTSHLSFIAAMDASEGRTLPAVRGYVYSFTGFDRNNAHAFACRLIWVATYTRLTHDAMAHGLKLDRVNTGQACHEAQLRFIRRFPDYEEWETYLSETFCNEEWDRD